MPPSRYPAMALRLDPVRGAQSRGRPRQSHMAIFGTQLTRVGIIDKAGVDGLHELAQDRKSWRAWVKGLQIVAPKPSVDTRVQPPRATKCRPSSKM